MHTIPGTLLNISEQGVLLRGPSGSGKSVLALSLLDRGHQLVADDAVWVEKEGDAILGRCPPLIQDFMAIKPLGLINVRKTLNAPCVCSRIPINLVINLDDTIQNPALEHEAYFSILHTAVPALTIPHFVPPIVIEVAVQNFLLKRNSYTALKEFEARCATLHEHSQANL
jgi:HPr kinase/phosphorylase